MASLNFNGLWDSEHFNSLFQNSELELIKITNCGVYKMIVKEGNITKSYLLKIYQTVPEYSSIFINKISVDKEVENQIDIYNLTIIEPLCPKINYYDELSYDNIEYLKQKILNDYFNNIKNNNINEDNKYVKSLLYIKDLYYFLGLDFKQDGGGNDTNNESSQGTAPYIPSNNEGTEPYIPSNNEGQEPRNVYILCMDYLEGYIPITNINIPKLYNNEIIIQTIQIIIELLIKTKYIHGDFHKENILFTMNDTTHFYKGIESYFRMNIRPMLIDFEHSYQVDNITYETLKKMYDEERYTDIIKFICDDTKSMRNMSRNIYDYLCQIKLNKKIINQKVKQYFKMREIPIVNFKFYNNQKEAENRGFGIRTRTASRNVNKSRKERSRSRNGSQRRNSRANAIISRKVNKKGRSRRNNENENNNE